MPQSGEPGGHPPDGRDADDVPSVTDVLARFTPATRTWFGETFAAPTPAQLGAWDAVSTGSNALVVAPTGSGKTLAAFLWALDRVCAEPADEENPLRRCRVLYVSPLKALAVDVERNLRTPLAGIRRTAERAGTPVPNVTVGVRSGDTPADERRRFAKRPPDVLITTPESLFLILTSQARESLRGVETVIVDEVHAVAGTKRGAHLALSLERLDALLDRPAQRIGLSATVRPPETVAAFLGGSRPVTVVQPPSTKEIEVQVVVPVPDLAEVGDGGAANDSGAPAGTSEVAQLDAPDRRSIWPHVEERIVDLVEEHRSTIVFANSRRLAERLTTRLNEIAHARATGVEVDLGVPAAAMQAQSGVAGNVPTEIAMAHHGSVSKERRALVEDELKSGRLPAVVATSSLELGVDMGAVDLVVQVESPPSVSSGMQRIGRAGHHVGATSRGVVFPKFRGDLVQTAVVAERMQAGLIESARIPRNPLDVLAQQIVATVALEDWSVEDLLELVRRAASFRELPRSVFESVLDMLAGRYPSDDFAELRPRIVWDRDTDVLRARPGAQMLAVTSGGTIPDRGLFGVHLVGEKGARVGELDEEMVYESRVGDVISLGSSSWRVEEITADRVLVTPAPGVPGRLPFWHGDALGRPAELGRAVGAFVRELGGLDVAARRARCTDAGLDEWATDNLLAYLEEQRTDTGHVPDDRTVVVERFRDELGDWRIVVHSVFGAQVNAPWALALGARLRERHGVDVQAMHSDDGIVLRLPDTEVGDDISGGGISDGALAELLAIGSEDVEELVTAEVGGSALFASRFRECAGRALLLPRRRPGRRSPLWQQRRRAQQLLEVASDYGTFPIVLETVRECLQDVFDVPALTDLLRRIETREVKVVDVTTTQASPFARSLLFGYVAAFMYEGDTPLAERKAAALTLDSALLAELLGQTELRELLDPTVVETVERELQLLTPERRARDAEDVADLLRVLGPLTDAELAARGAEPAWVDSLADQRRVVTIRVAGEDRRAAVEDAGRLRDALGAALPVGLPEAFLEPVDDPLGDLVSRYARTHGPFTTAEAAARLGLGPAVVETALRGLVGRGRVVRGELRPGATGTEHCDAEVLRQLRRRSVAALRREAEPVPQSALARFLPAWQHVGGGLRGPDGVLRVVEQLAGTAVPASAWESWVLPARVADYSPAHLDELTNAGEVAWVGRGSLPGSDGWLSLLPSDGLTDLLPLRSDDPPTPVEAALLGALDGGGALFFRDLADRVRAARDDGVDRDTGDDALEGLAIDEASLATALWDLVWAGRVTNDTLAPVRALLTTGRSAHRSKTPAPRSRYGRTGSTRARGRAMGAPLTPRGGTASTSGRWWSLPEPTSEVTKRSVALAEAMLDRHGVLTRGAVTAEGMPGGFAAAYRVLSALEDAGRTRRAYAIEGLGAAQFALPGAVDRLRQEHQDTSRRRTAPVALALAATDPANPFGAALPWPAPGPELGGHRPGRKAGALVVLVDGELALYVERGGRSLLSWTTDPDLLTAAVAPLAAAVRTGGLGTLAVERADGVRVNDTALGAALAAAGFHATPRGLRLRS